MRKITLLLTFLIICVFEIQSQDSFIIENNITAFHFSITDGGLKLNKQELKENNISWNFENAYFFKDSIKQETKEYKIKKRTISGNRVVTPHKEVEILFYNNTFSKKLVLRLYPNSSFIACDAYFKGSITEKEAKTLSLFKTISSNRHWFYKAVEFFDQTDHHNNLVSEKEVLGFEANSYLNGNLLFRKNMITNNSLIVLKEAPCSFVQINHPGYDFEVSKFGMTAKGLGFFYTDINKTKWTKSYSIAISGSLPDELSQLQILRNYHKSIRTYKSEWDEMIMMNTWGDRNRDANIGETFVKGEIDACKQLGITHFQIDDGWQQGLSKNSSVNTGNKWMSWEEEDWQPHKDRFPNGFTTIVNYAKKRGIKLGLWFAPSSINSYERWKIDADILINLHKNYDIRYFKIDGVSLPNKLAEENLRKLYARVLEETENQVFFNVDATSNARAGYHFLYEYGGNIFLENRYTTFKKYYYPYQTLRNLWMLSKYIPAERFQIEFLNKWKNQKTYLPKDKYAPINVPFDYIFATTMMAQPLAWFEGSQLPKKGKEIHKLIKQYKTVKEAIHKGIILPIGDSPNGSSWTGFQSISSDSKGFIIIYREDNYINSTEITAYLSENNSYKFTKVLGDGKVSKISKSNNLKINIDKPYGFFMFKYEQK